MSYFIYTDLISSFLDPRLVDPGSTLIHVGACGPKVQNVASALLYVKYSITC